MSIELLNNTNIKLFQERYDTGMLSDYFKNLGFNMEYMKFNHTKTVVVTKYIKGNQYYLFNIKWNKRQLKFEIVEIEKGI